jgi:hypothetical protein
MAKEPENKETATTEKNENVTTEKNVSLQTIYIKDLSFEAPNSPEVFLEQEITKGETVIAYPKVLHGVKTIDEHKKPNWNEDPRGRWFLGLYTNDSNEITNRITSHRV